jgi:hypothetical protein
MNLEIQKFKNQIVVFDFNSELGFSFLEEEIYNENTADVFFRYQLKNNLNKIISFTYYPCNRLLTSNEIEVTLVYPNGGSTSLSEYLAHNSLNKKLYYEDVLPYRFKVDCDNLVQSILFQLNNISNLLNGDFKKYLITEEFLFIPTHDLRDDY